jgi:hypothetical protein
VAEQSGETARATLAAAFTGRAEAVEVGNRDRVGIFGNGVPEALLTAAGLHPVDVRSSPDGPPAEAPAISALVEPFVDDHARLFLHRLFSGRLDHLAAIVFPRDDAAALSAFQFAREFVRLGIAACRPRLCLFNLIHRDGPAALRFNRAQVERLWSELGVATPSDAALSAALANERLRAASLARLDAARSAGRVSGTDAVVWRNAGRFAAAGRHATLLDAALATPAPAPTGPRLALIGAPTDDISLYTALETLGPIVADPHPMGDVWPGPLPSADSLDALLIAAAADPFCPRIVPPARHPEAVIAACVAARAGLALFQLDQHDDLLGWDLPTLRSGLAAHGIALVDIGFRDHRPDANWRENALATIRAAMEVRT